LHSLLAWDGEEGSPRRHYRRDEEPWAEDMEESETTADLEYPKPEAKKTAPRV